MASTDLTARARATAEALLSPLGLRWDHVQAVGRLAEEIAWAFEPHGEFLVASAYLHDIGYAPDVIDTGFHPLDGARAVRNAGFPQLVASLVAYHSMAQVEADLRGLGRQLAEEFPLPDARLADALCYCDMVTGPAGKPILVEERLDEIQGRYGADHVVTAFVDHARPEIISTVRRVTAQLEAGQTQPM